MIPETKWQALNYYKRRKGIFVFALIWWLWYKIQAMATVMLIARWSSRALVMVLHIRWIHNTPIPGSPGLYFRRQLCSRRGLGFRNGADDLYLDAEPNTKPCPKWETLSKLSNAGFSFYLISFYGLRGALEELLRWNQLYLCGSLVENEEYGNNQGNHNSTSST